MTLPDPERLVDDPPDSWLGMQVEWVRVPNPEPLFLDSFELDDGHSVLVFGARYNLADVLVAGESFGEEGHVLEYFVAEDGERVIHRLRQRGGVVYTETEESQVQEHVPAAEIGDPAALAVRKPPNWKVSEASWPTYNGAPMTFVGQSGLPKTDATDELFAWGLTFYLFAAPDGESRTYKIFHQDTQAQTAEEHYELEEDMQHRSEAAESNGS